MTSPASADGLAAYVLNLTSPQCIQFCVERTGVPRPRVQQVLVDYAGEVVFGAAVLSPIPLTGKRVLEVGAGLGLLGVWLRRQGVAIVMLEPGAGGFDDNGRLLAALQEWLGAREIPVIAEPAQDLDPARHGLFDVIFSVNVLEHIPHVECALDAMLRVLAPAGVMRHTCPNYTVPYDPHYALPLIPFAPQATAALVPRVRGDELWQSLNFITYSRVARFCRARGLDVTFDRGMLAQAFSRIGEDPAFRARRGRIAPAVYEALKRSGLLTLVRMLPPRWATPMAFSCWRR